MEGNTNAPLLDNAEGKKKKKGLDFSFSSTFSCMVACLLALIIGLSLRGNNIYNFNNFKFKYIKSLVNNVM